MLEVLNGGIFATVQDGGRPGYRNQGVPISGAMDSLAMQVANLLLRQPRLAPVIEVTFGHSAFRFGADGWGALTGGDLGATLDGMPLNPACRFRIRRGQTLRFDHPRHGLRAYLALAGTLEVPRVLGSASTDAGSGFNVPLASGDHLRWQPEREFAQPLQLRNRIGRRIRALRGSDYEGFVPASRQALWDGPWQVTSDTDRVGCRLDGPELRRGRAAEFPSRGVMPGTIQVPGDGQPVVLGVDAGATGGYPVIGQVISADLWQLGQIGPGDSVTFMPCTLAGARLAWQKQQDYLREIETFAAAH